MSTFSLTGPSTCRDDDDLQLGKLPVEDPAHAVRRHPFGALRVEFQLVLGPMGCQVQKRGRARPDLHVLIYVCQESAGGM